MSTIVFVCTGNTCRSPMAAALTEAIFKQQGIHATVLSAGVAAGSPSPASKNAIRAMRDDKIDIKRHRSTQVTIDFLQGADLILALTSSHLDAVMYMHPKANAFTLGEFSGLGGDVSDPFGGDIAIYRECAAQIKKMIESVDIEKWKTISKEDI